MFRAGNSYERYFNSMVENMIKVAYEWPTKDNRIVILQQHDVTSAKLLGAFALATRPILLERVRRFSESVLLLLFFCE